MKISNGTRKIFNVFIIVFILSTLALPIYSFAYERLVTCGTEVWEKGKIIDGKDVGGLVSNPCDFDHLMAMVNRVINFMLFVMALPIAAIMFAYAGFLLVFSGGEAGKRTKAKDIFFNVAIGLILAAACWLIVHTILSIVGYDASWIGL